MPQPPWSTERGVESALARWLADDWIKPCFVADETIPDRKGSYAPIPEGLDKHIAQAFWSRGIGRLYTHQARAISSAMSGRHVVISTPTASGKSLCFHAPVLHALAQDREARALYLYPTKALARDQESSLSELAVASGLSARAVVYDGDTPADARRAARERAPMVLTNPDMLHTGILPHHAAWARTFQNLRYIVIDELHTYKGIFGSHVANVLRRLVRVARFHGSNPRFVGASATIGNARMHAARLYGVPEADVDLVDESGAPRGQRRFFLFNPPAINAELGIRASYIKQAVMLASELVRAEVPTIVFGQSRNSVEVMLRYLRDAVARDPRTGHGIAPDRIVAYRGGYLPGQRREIERRLRAGEVLCVVATNALELGIDVGELDAVICAGYPGSIAATWQRFGRAGRRSGLSICVLVASSAPLDQFLAREPSFLLGSPVEEARIDPDNVEVLVQHVKCAAFEVPFKRGEAFGSLGPAEAGEALDFLANNHVLHASGDTFHWASDSYPANDVSLRTAGWDNVVIIDSQNERAIGELDWPSAHTMLHDQAIYQHDGDCWEVERFDYENHKAFVRRVEPDYWTNAMTYVRVAILERSAEADFGQPAFASGWGEVSVVEKTVGYKKIKFYTHENSGYGDVRLPEMQMHTNAFWLSVPEAMADRFSVSRAAVIEGLRGAGVALETVATLALMCDPRDLGTTLGDATPGSPTVPGATTQESAIQPTHTPTLFIYEHVPGGTGLAERMWERRASLLLNALRLVEGCACASGCPSCVGPGDEMRKAHALRVLGAAVAASS